MIKKEKFDGYVNNGLWEVMRYYIIFIVFMILINENIREIFF